ncbi:MAG: carbamoyl-phosphate synthase large subunit [Bacteroidia bacterium]|jgi:carbamoyl-phosphate synthase large subunit
MERKCIAVTGIGGNVGQGIIRNIRNSYPDILIVGLDILEFTPGNYLCDKTYKVPYSYESNYIDTVVEIIKREKINLIIPSTDYEVYYLSLNQDRLNSIIAASDAQIAKLYLDKYRTFIYHRENDIPFVKSWIPEEYDSSEKDIIAKPREGRGSRGILINPDRIDNLPDGYMVQRLLVGKEITTAVYATKEETLHGIFTMERELTNGATTKAKVIFEYNEELERIAKKMISLGGLKGAFNIQSIVTKEGEILPFEINCRISGTNSIRHNLGFQDVRYVIEEYLYNRTPTPANPQKGIATRILLDVIYPNATDENSLNSKYSTHIVY